MDQRQIDRIEAYVNANRECSEDDVAIALDLHIFDVLEGLHELERRGRLRSEPIEHGDAPLPDHLTAL